MNASDARHLKRKLQSFVHGANLNFARTCYAKTCQITCLPIIQASQAKVRGSIMAGAEL